VLGDISQVEAVYLACGYTDMRRGIDGLAGIVREQFQLDPFSNSLFLFCGKRRDRIKALLWEGDGFVLLYKRMEHGSFQWPRSQTQARQLSWQEFRWLMEGLSVDQPKAHRPVTQRDF
jgi:transposase